MIAAIAAALTGSEETGLDIAHEAMLRAYREWPSKVARLDRPGAWVRRVAINLAIDTSRRDRRRRAGLARLSLERERIGEPSAEGDFWSAVRALPPRQRTVVALHYVEDMPVHDIAVTLGVGDGAVRSALFVARQQLARMMPVEEVES